MAITGAHVILYSPEAEALRKALGDILGGSPVDAGGGWLIFTLPPSEIAVHPGPESRHQLTLMCDDLEATMAQLISNEVSFKGEIEDEVWGLVITMVLPGDVEVLLYEPRHPTAI